MIHTVVLTSAVLLFHVTITQSSLFDNPSAWCSLLSPEDQLKSSRCVSLMQANAEDQNVSKDNENDPMTNHDIFEGDILGFDVYKTSNISPEAMEGFKNAVRDEEKRWPGGIVPYKISDSFSEDERAIIMKAIGVFHEKTCVQFRERITETDYINISPRASAIDHLQIGDNCSLNSGCNSYTGRQSKKQDVSISPDGCMKSGIVQHELMHALGFYHEQSRTDRDNFVEINWDNIIPEDHTQFQKYTDQEITGFGYDYDFSSVLHYKMYDFAKDPNIWTIRPKLEYRFTTRAAKMGQRDGMSLTDINKINAMYQCTKPASCPDDEAWKASEDKCFYFSFLDNEEQRNWIGARNFCRQKWSALLVSPSTSSILLIQRTMQENREQIDIDEKLWLNNMKTMGADSDEITDHNVEDKLHFVCSTRRNALKKKFSTDSDK